MPRARRPFLLALLPLILVLRASAQEPLPGAATPAALAEGVAAALNERDAAAARALLGAAPPAWMEPILAGRGPSRSPGSRWHGNGAVLPGPAGRGESVVVLSAYHPVESEDDHFHRVRRVAGRWRLGEEIVPEETAKQFRIRHHRMRVRLTPAEYAMSVTDRMTVERTGNGSLLVTGLSRDFSVRSVRREGSDLPFTRAGGLLAVSLPDSAERRLTLEIAYEGVVDHEGWDRIAPEGTFVFSYWYPHIGRLPATAEVAITAPAALTVVGQGELQGTREADGEKTWNWKQAHPVCWVMFAAGTYHATERVAAGKRLAVYLMQPDPERAKETLDRLVGAMALFTKRFGPFPWSQYTVVEHPLRAGGLESYSFTVCSPRSIPGAVVHELAHSWWGGVVPNTYRQDMWNEAFATYSDRLYQEEVQGRRRPVRGTGGEGERRFGSVPISQATNALDGRHSSVGYTKGAAVLHLTRRRIGDEPFFRSLKTFAKRYHGRAATWRDYAGVVEEIAGPEMRPFFDQWLERPGVPRLRWGRAAVTPVASGGFRLDLEVAQEAPAYHLEVPLAIETGAGDRLMRSLSLREEQGAFTFDLPTAPVRLRLDPEQELPLTIERPAGATSGDPAVLDLSAQPSATSGRSRAARSEGRYSFRACPRSGY
jgi:aminopeptidase N